GAGSRRRGTLGRAEGPVSRPAAGISGRRGGQERGVAGWSGGGLRHLLPVFDGHRRVRHPAGLLRRAASCAPDRRAEEGGGLGRRSVLKRKEAARRPPLNGVAMARGSVL